MNKILFISDKTKIYLVNTVLLLITFLSSCFYFLINTSRPSLNILQTIIDVSIPRLPIFAIPYVAFLPLFWSAMVYAFIKNKSFRRLACSVVIINLVAYLVYLFFQTYVPRLPVEPNDLFSGLLNFIYTNDQPYNCFPSLHVALSVSAATYFMFIKHKMKWLFLLIAVLISLSTLFVKQHFVLDVLSGAVLGFGVTWLMFKIKHPNRLGLL
jgi:membrane-associated phospholipid phosphatase